MIGYGWFSLEETYLGRRRAVAGRGGTGRGGRCSETVAAKISPGVGKRGLALRRAFRFKTFPDSFSV